MGDPVLSGPDHLGRRTLGEAEREDRQPGGGLPRANGDLLTVNGGDNNLVELNQRGAPVAMRDLDTKDQPGGALFGLAPTAHPRAVYYVNDDNNTLNVLH
jgi:hypothetical protein